MLRISARAWAPAEIGAPRSMEIIALGKTVRKVESSSPERTELKAEMSIPASESQWFAVRVESQNGRTGVYLAGVCHRRWAANPRPRPPELVKKRLLVLDHIEMRLQQQSHLSSYAPGEAEAHRERVRQTRALYEGLLNCGDADAGAIGCFFRAMRE